MAMVALGPFRFSSTDMPLNPTGAFDRFLAMRQTPVMVQGQRPPLHNTGPLVEEIRITATIYPEALGGNGLAQVDGMRAAAEFGTAMILSSGGRIYHPRWVIASINDIRSYYSGAGSAQKVELDMVLYSTSSGRLTFGSVARLFS
jgi:phage protein U